MPHVREYLFAMPREEPVDRSPTKSAGQSEGGAASRKRSTPASGHHRGFLNRNFGDFYGGSKRLRTIKCVKAKSSWEVRMRSATILVVVTMTALLNPTTPTDPTV
jgi:hypothetical protein